MLSNLICTEGITRMTENIVPKERHEAMKAEYAANAVLVLCHEDCPTTGKMYQTEGGQVRKFKVERSRGLLYDPKTQGIDYVMEQWDQTNDFTKQRMLSQKKQMQSQTKQMESQQKQMTNDSEQKRRGCAVFVCHQCHKNNN